MIPLPSLPTDNLYKTLAILGLIAFIAGEVAEIVSVQRLLERSNEFLAQANRVKLEIDFLEEDKREFAEEVTTLRKRAHSLTTKESDDLTKRVNDLRNTERDIKRKRLEITNSYQTAKDLQRLDGLEGMWTSLATNIGLGMMFIGFLLWEYRIQRFQDRILKAQAAALAINQMHEKTAGSGTRGP